MGHIEFNTSDIKLCLGAAEVSAAYLGDEKVYPNIDEQDYFSITNDDANEGCFFTLQSYKTNFYLTLDLEYSYDKKTWTKWPTSDDDRLWLGAENINPATKTAYIRGNNTTISPNDSDYISFFCSGTSSYHAGGNIMSLLRKKNFDTLTSVPDYCFYCLFMNELSMTAAPKLPATTVGAYAYQDMFNGCTALLAAPELPATTLGTSCYAYMFTGCTHMTTAPALPATTLTNDCYRSMFYNCKSLTTAPALPATTLASGCYRNMFTGCSSLTTAPALPATQLVSFCYREMFKMCTSLNYIKALFISTPGTDTTDWVAGVTTTGTFVKNVAATWTDVGNNAVPSGWTIETASS